MPPVGAQVIAELDIANPLAVVALVPERIPSKWHATGTDILAVNDGGGGPDRTRICDLYRVKVAL